MKDNLDHPQSRTILMHLQTHTIQEEEYVEDGRISLKWLVKL
jgi:hypothetical protein